MLIFSVSFQFYRMRQLLHCSRILPEPKDTNRWGCSSNGRAPALHAGGTGIDTLLLHLFLRAAKKEDGQKVANPSFDLGTFRL